MLIVEWKESAAADLDQIVEYITQHNPIAADHLEERILELAELLSAQPYMGRSGRVAGTRELLAHPNYWLVYRVGHSSVDIVGVIHTKREYPKN